MNYCWSRGPRMGYEATPVCFRPEGHSGSHQSHPESGLRESWGEPAMTVPGADRINWWQPSPADEQLT